MSTTAIPTAAGTTSPRRRRVKPSLDSVSFFAVFLGLPIGIYALFVLWPFAQAVAYSFTSWSGFSPDVTFVGIDNYIRIFNDPLWLTAMKNNLLLLIVVPLLVIFLSLTLAIVITVGGSSKGNVRGLAASSFYRIVSFFPYCIPAVVIGILWAQVFDPSNGPVNALLTDLGLAGFEAFPWLGDARTAMPVAMFVMLWGFVGFYMVLFVAAIKSIPAEIFEAARIDGAGRWTIGVRITLPLIRENVQTAYIYLGIMAIDAFVYMQAMFPFGGPQNTTLTMSQRLFRVAFQDGLFGVACAMGVVIAVLTLIMAAIVFTVNRFTGGKDQVTLA
ncbi:carbohydrate ABC transporter permease [Parenemella sanctibonifatiensis]|uniref:Sugar ABC transporter permease n=1 Tax=Parenemella sanctibonifatiensis TaxID=2016505 RepID=A0A255EDY9_9ACTN|nr:sugar ABC transporter permease [Parenemella sanctibonifatiensis]OYN89460.1 sugar ABC transporter permease [Parenemella sanctibonifatiensis]